MAVWARAERARRSMGVRAGVAVVKSGVVVVLLVVVVGEEGGGARERRVKDAILGIGRMWYVPGCGAEALVGEVGVGEAVLMAMRLVMGQAVKRVPSRVLLVGMVVVMRMLLDDWGLR